MSSVNIWINDHEVEVGAAQTIMEAADQAGIAIPRLCSHPSLKPSGSCRLCAVEIDDYRGLPAACTTPVAEGMRVRTESPKVLDFRRETLRLILQDHPRECLGCPRNGTCELQQLTAAIGIDFPYAPPSRERPPTMQGGAYFERDYSLCVRCGRCVRACHEIRGAKAIVFRERAGRQEVGTPLDTSLAEAGCEFCGACVDVCPVGALREKLEVWQGEGREQLLQVCENLANIVMTLFRKEMPGSWETSVCPICPAGCRMDFELAGEREIVQVCPSRNGTQARGQACFQGRFLLKSYLRRSDRLSAPFVREGRYLREESWENALDQVAQKLSGFGPDEIAVLTSARLTNEEIYLLGKFARDGLNTTLVGSFDMEAHPATGVLTDNPGRGAENGVLSDLRHSDCVLVFGLNPPATHPIAGVNLREAVMSGTKLVVAGPCHTAPTRYSDIHLRHYPGTEASVISGLLRLLLDSNQIDPEVAEKHAIELKSLRESLAEYDPETISKITGTPLSDLVEAACLVGNAKALSIVYGPGMLTAAHPGDTIRAMHTLMRIRGSVGRQGAIIAQAFGDGNFKGEREIHSAFAPATQAHIFDALASGKVKALYVAMESMEADPLGPLRPWLGKLDFAVIQDMAMPGEEIRDTLPSSCVFLPMASVLEKGGTFSSGGQKIRRIKPVLPAPAQARSALWVLRELARIMGAPGFNYESFEAVQEEICRQVPFYADPALSENRGAGQWTYWRPKPAEVAQDGPDKEFPFALVSKERLRPYFLGPLLADETAVLFNSPADVEMNPADAFSMGLAPGDTVRVITRGGEWEGRLGMNHFLMRNMVAAASSLWMSSGSRESKCLVSAAKVEKR